MAISNSYVRALVANLPFFAIIASWLWYREHEPGFFGFFVALVLGAFPSLIVSLFVGMFLRSRDELRTWRYFGFACLVGWCVLLILWLVLAAFLLPTV
jgi:hypothetical protein